MGLFKKKRPKKEPELTVEQVERELLGEPKAPKAPPTPTVLGHEIPPRRISQPEWEYKTVFETGWNYQTSYEDAILNSYGQEGWELVQIRDATYDLQSRVIFTFKRRIG
jgi:hypothetical protein